MSGIKDSEHIDEMRQRLYERNSSTDAGEAPSLTPVENTIRRDFNHAATRAPEPAVPTPLPTNDTPMPRRPRRHTYRIKLLLAGMVFFVGALLISSLILIFGNNSISAQNITISVTGPFTIGGGEVLPLQIGIANNNAVPIESATLIINYPAGTKEPDNLERDLFTQRVPLETIESGQTLNLPVKAAVFGQENEEKQIYVSIEYRVQGSNATFFKEAAPLVFKISSSPVVLEVEALEKVSAGQEVDFTLTVRSNAPTPITDILVQAEYPVGFDFSSAQPAPSGGQNVWRIETLEPEAAASIVIRGVIIGSEDDEYTAHFSVGVPSERDPQSLASIFATAQTNFVIENPFLDVMLTVNGSAEATVSTAAEDRSQVGIKVTNTLQDTLYDAKVVASLSGNAFSLFNTFPNTGFFDAKTNTVTWDVTNTPGLTSLTPGASLELTFGVTPDTSERTPQVVIKVDVSGRRVSEGRSTEALVGTDTATIRVATIPEVTSAVSYNGGIFNDFGPVPPEVGKTTTYTVSLQLENGSNDITNTVLVASLPPYIEWVDQTTGDGAFSYNTTNRVIEWNIGNVEAGAAAVGAFQISFEPRITQVGTIPTLLEEQRVRATDRFTGTVVRDTNPAVTTELPGQAGSGTVQN